MKSPDSPPVSQGPWTSLWVVTLLSLAAQLWLCQFFSLGAQVPLAIDVNPSNLWKFAYHFPPTGTFQVLNWLGIPYLPVPLNPLSLAAHLPPWWFFTAYAPVIVTLALLAMVAFLRELELSRPAALFGGLVYAWQGDLLPFVYPGHFGYITSWPFFALAAWGALRAARTDRWAYAVIKVACCGIMVGLLTNADRGGIASLLVAILYLAPVVKKWSLRWGIEDYAMNLRHLALCVATAALIALAPLLGLIQSNIVGVKIAGATEREQQYELVTQYSLGPAETLTYLAPGFFGWHINSNDGPYWGWIGEWPGWPKHHEGQRNSNLAISTTGTVATVLALIGMGVVLPGGLLGASRVTARQRFYGCVLMALGFVTLILAWGWHTGIYWHLFALPLMDKWRNPLKWLEMTNFALVVLSALGVQHLLASLEAEAPGVKSIRLRLAWLTNGLLVVLASGLAASYLFAPVLEMALQLDTYPPAEVDVMMGTMHLSLVWALVLMALFCLLLRAFWRPDSLRGWSMENPWLRGIWQRMLEPRHVPLTFALGLAVLAVVQLGWVASQFITPAPMQIWTEPVPLVDALRSEGQGGRVRVSVAVEDPRLDTLLQDQFAATDISSLDVSAASRIPDDLNTFFRTLQNHRERLWFLAGVKNLALPQEDVAALQQEPTLATNVDHANGYVLQAPEAANLPTHALVGMKDYLSKATLVPDFEVLASDEALLKRLADPAWNPRASVLLAAPVLPLKGDSAGEADQVEMRKYTPTEIEVAVQSKQGGFVLINDQYDPDWQAQIDGKPAQILRADYIMRAVQVPPGNSTVTMRYIAHYRGLPAEAVNLFSDFVMLAAWVVAGWVLRRSKLAAKA